MNIHFVCEGNTYRSRLAEAYGNSKISKGHTATSSGVRAAENVNGPISWVAAFLLKKNFLIPFMANGSWVQTSREVLERNDHIIFMSRPSFEFAKEYFEGVNIPYEVWDIADIEQSALEDDENILATIKIAKGTFAAIRERVDRFVKEKGLEGCSGVCPS